MSLNANQENLQTHILDELDFQFDVIGISETKITNSNSNNSIPKIPGYHFEFVPTPLASGGVGLFIKECYSYRILEKTSNEAFQALWLEISFVKKKNIICGAFTDNTIHLRDSSNTLTKLLRDIMPLESVSAYSAILILTF